MTCYTIAPAADGFYWVLFHGWDWVADYATREEAQARADALNATL